jgi:SAM-dependent methyltransferase
MAKESLQQCLDVARKRLHPSLTNPNYLVLRRRREIISRWIERLPGREWRVLDIGGRYQPYRPLLEPKTKSYIALDVIATALVNVIASGESLPFATGSFDLVIATQVFEYFDQPQTAAKEIHRVLTPGGCLLMSVAAVAPRFVDDERWRYLPAGLRYILSPFSTVEIIPEVFSVGSFFRTVNLSLSLFANYSWLRWTVHYTVVPMLNIMALMFETFARNQNDQLAANYSALAQK